MVIALVAAASVAAAQASGLRGDRLPISSRVVHGTLAGISRQGRPLFLRTPKATEAALDSDNPRADEAALRREGFVRAALQRFGDGNTSFGMSLVIQLASANDARAELSRNVAMIRRDAAHPPKGTSGRVFRDSRIPGSTAFVERFPDNGRTAEFAGVVFSDGPYYYLVEAGAPDELLDEHAIYDAAVRLYKGVHAQP